MTTLKRSSGILGIALLFYGFQWAIRLSPSAMAQDLMDSFVLHSGQVGLLTSLYYYSYGVLQIPMGLLFDRFGLKHILVGAVFLCTLGTFLFSISHGIIPASIARFLMGAGGAAAFIGTMKIAKLFFPSRYLGRLTGVIMVAGTIGAMGSSTMLAYLVEHIAWRPTLLGLAIIGAIITLLIVLFLTEPSIISKEVKPAWKESIQEILTNKSLWSLAFWCAMLHGPTIAFVDLWGNGFFMETYGLGCGTASHATSALFLGIGIGSILIGTSSDLFQNRRIFIAGGGIGSLILFSWSIYAPPPSFLGMELLMMALGICLSSKLLAFTAITETTKAQISGTAIGIVNSVSMIFGAMMQPIVGHILVASQKFHSHISLTLTDYQWGFSAITMALIFGVLILPLTRKIQ